MTTRIIKKHETIYKELLGTKKRNFIEQKLTNNIGKLKELWKILRGIGAPSKNKLHSNNHMN